VCALTGLGASTIRKMVRARTFPQPKALGHNLRLWRAGDVRAWLKSKAAPEGAAAAGELPG
jgi:predicted DNA-binding transcriptional regulator AlpA